MFTRSPFPGMDPWLERRWGSVHYKFIDDLSDQIAAGLPAGLYVEVEEDLYVTDPDTPEFSDRVRSDVSVTEQGPGDPALAGVGTLAVAEPIRVVVDTEPVTQGHIEIRETRDGHPLVTAVEVLGPTNKRGRIARAEYRRKRTAYQRAGANVVELDLLRGGRHLIDVPLRNLRPDVVTPYKCGVWRPDLSVRHLVDFYPLPLRERLPRIRVPLRPTDADVVVDLQAPVDKAYARGRYGTRIDYDRPPVPPLSADDTAWAADRVAAARAGGV